MLKIKTHKVNTGYYKDNTNKKQCPMKTATPKKQNKQPGIEAKIYPRPEFVKAGYKVAPGPIWTPPIVATFDEQKLRSLDQKPL